MERNIEWKEILMVFGTALGGILSAIFFLAYRNDAVKGTAFWLIILGLAGGAFLGLIIDRFQLRHSKN
jgi:hypothetical protein